MIQTITKLGIPGTIGFLIGLFAIWWVEPTTSGGAGLLLAICIACIIAVSGLRRLITSLLRAVPAAPSIAAAPFDVGRTYRETAKTNAEIDEFRNGIKIELYPDGSAALLKDLNYYVGRKESGLLIVVPAGFRTDFASIPWAFQWLVRKHGAYNGPAVLHDWLYQTQKVGFRLANAIMYDAMVEAGVAPLTRSIIYFAVRTPFAAYAYWTGPNRLRKTCPDLAEHIVS